MMVSKEVHCVLMHQIWAWWGPAMSTELPVSVYATVLLLILSGPL